ncbi:MAG: Sulfur oxidation protein SoxY [uncultured Sulfurovum sp.]|uniref:Sulfur oxidation protein SoxY n=1 Tax=uncultured Sulfurovum sp. TaxID=269237 RepID=A0A6S6TN56_9BACT|nr:MAG: Sulfur oxidation protein SoxY [uncultured Sulfurovum sp.]
MERRKFLGLGLAAATLVPASLSAVDFRATKPAAWSATTVADAIKALYGDIKAEESGIKLTVPKKAANPGAVPVKIKSKIPMKSITILQDANAASAVATYTMDKDTIVDLSIKIKMGKPGTITVIGEGQDGKFYSVAKKVDLGEAC